MSNRIVSIFAFVLVALLSGCTGTTPISRLELPPVNVIQGSITQLDGNGFTLADSSGSIYVRARLPGNKRLPLSPDENVRVYGNLMGGEESIFDGYVIKKATGEQIMISRPSPHFGFILQSSFR